MLDEHDGETGARQALQQPPSLVVSASSSPAAGSSSRSTAGAVPARGRSRSIGDPHATVCG